MALLKEERSFRSVRIFFEAAVATAAAWWRAAGSGCSHKIFKFDGSNTVTNNMFSVKYQLFLMPLLMLGLHTTLHFQV